MKKGSGKGLLMFCFTRHTKAQRIILVWRNCEEQLTPSQRHIIRNASRHAKTEHHQPFDFI